MRVVTSMLRCRVFKSDLIVLLHFNPVQFCTDLSPSNFWWRQCQSWGWRQNFQEILLLERLSWWWYFHNKKLSGNSLPWKLSWWWHFYNKYFQDILFFENFHDIFMNTNFQEILFLERRRALLKFLDLYEAVDNIRKWWESIIMIIPLIFIWTSISLILIKTWLETTVTVTVSFMMIIWLKGARQPTSTSRERHKRMRTLNRFLSPSSLFPWMYSQTPLLALEGALSKLDFHPNQMAIHRD